MVHLLGNAPICSSTVLECSCCRILRYVAGPLCNGALLPVHDVQVGGGRHVGLEADVAELRLRGDVDRHVLAQPGIHRIL
jgi:hypothetical protein